MTGTDWWVTAAMAALLTVTLIWDRIVARRQHDVDADRRARARLLRELERQP